jgi:hypothetical protein
VAVQATAKLFRKPEQQNAFRQAVRVEAAVLCQAHQEYLERHVDMVRRERIKRGLSVQDLPAVVEPPVEVAEVPVVVAEVKPGVAPVTAPEPEPVGEQNENKKNNDKDSMDES